MTLTPPPEEDRRVRPFSDFLRDQSNGRTHEELSEKLHDLIAAVTSTNKAGSITLTIKLTPVSKTESGVLAVTDSVTVKAPQKARKESVFFVAGDGNLSRTNPDQPSFETLKDVSAEAADSFRDVSDDRDDAQRAAGDR